MQFARHRERLHPAHSAHAATTRATPGLSAPAKLRRPHDGKFTTAGNVGRGHAKSLGKLLAATRWARGLFLATHQ